MTSCLVSNCASFTIRDNCAGKSTLLKTVAHITILAHVPFRASARSIYSLA